jgi:hypothetical protein
VRTWLTCDWLLTQLAHGDNGSAHGKAEVVSESHDSTEAAPDAGCSSSDRCAWLHGRQASADAEA